MWSGIIAVISGLILLGRIVYRVFEVVKTGDVLGTDVRDK
jgi:hypothetical protein